MRATGILLVSLLANAVDADFNFGSREGSCHGTERFEQQIPGGTRVRVGDIPPGLLGLEIRLDAGDADVDLQLTSSSSVEVVNWKGSVIWESSEVTKTWSGDSITYSGYNGNGTGLGNEYMRFGGENSNAYEIHAYGYASGFATVTYTWTGQANCTEQGPPASGSGKFSQAIELGMVVTFGELPAGLTDVYIRLDSASDLDIQVYEGSVALVSRDGGLVHDSRFQEVEYSGLRIQYSGYNGEQRSGTYGQEYVLIQGTLPRTLSLRVLANASGTADINYAWGYYSNATSTDRDLLKQQLHDAIGGHARLSYSPGVWDAIKRTDQDMNNPDNVMLFYTRRSEPKSDQDNGSNGEDAWNREHIYAKSHGDFGTAEGPGTDIHALRAADKSVNAERSNKDFAAGGTQLSNAEARDDCPLCLETDESFEPPDEVKGDVARMIFYMVVRYNGDNDSDGVALNVADGVGTDEGPTTANNGVIGDLASLKAWHEQDPVSDEEKHRNNIIYDIQGNRNPFIDNPHFVDIIF